MASNVEEIVLKARDEASGLIHNVTGQLGFMGDALQKVAQTAGPVGLGIAAVGAALGGIVLMGKSVSDTVEQLDLLSARTGVSIERLQVFQQIIKEAGGSPEALTTALTFLNRSIATSDPLLAQLGITSKDTFTAFMQLSDAFSRSTDTAKKTEIAYKLLGRGSAELLALLPQMSSGFDDMAKKAKDAGTVIGEDVAKQARDLDENMDTLSRNWEGALTRMKSAAVPWALDLIEKFNDLWDAVAGKTKAPTTELDANIRKVQRELETAERFREGVADRVATQGPGVFGMGTEQIKQLDKHIEELKARIVHLRDLHMTIEEEDAAFAAAFMKAGRPDVVASTELTEDPAAKARAEKIAEYRELLKGTGIDATFAYEKIKQLNDESARIALVDKITLGPHVTQEVKDVQKAYLDLINVMHKTPEQATAELELRALAETKEKAAALEAQARRTRDALILGPLPKESVDEYIKTYEELIDVLGLTEEEAAAAIRKRDERRAAARKHDLKDEFDLTKPMDVVKEWSTHLDTLTTSVALTEAALQGVFAGLRNGFGDAFNQMITGVGTFGSVTKAIIDAIKQALIELAVQLAAILAMKALVSAIPGLGPVAKFLGFATTGPAEELLGIGDALMQQQRALGQQLAALRPSVTASMDALTTEFAALHPVIMVDAQLDARGLARQVGALRPTTTLAQPREASITARMTGLQQQLLEPLERAIAQLKPTSDDVARSQPAPMNIVVQGYDNYSIVQDLMSPAGKLRYANTRVSFMGAY